MMLVGVLPEWMRFLLTGSSSHIIFCENILVRYRVKEIMFT